jgi:hypothetical protein
MRSFHSLSNLTANLQSLFNRDWTFSNLLSQGLSGDQLQGKETHTIYLFQAIDGGDVGVIERGQELGFPLKSSQPLRIFGELLRQNLDGNFTAQVGVLGPIHFSHAALADLF